MSLWLKCSCHKNVDRMMCGRPSWRLVLIKRYIRVSWYVYMYTIILYIPISNIIFVSNIDRNVFTYMKNFLDFVYIPRMLWKFMQILCNRYNYIKYTYAFPLSRNNLIFHVSLFTFLYLPRSQLHICILTLALAFWSFQQTKKY